MKALQPKTDREAVDLLAEGGRQHRLVAFMVPLRTPNLPIVHCIPIPYSLLTMSHSTHLYPGSQGIAQLIGAACGRRALSVEEGQILEWSLTQLALEGSGPVAELTRSLQTSLIAGCDWHAAVASALLQTPRQWGAQLQSALLSFEEIRDEYRESEVAVFQFADEIIKANMLQVPALPGFVPSSSTEDPRTKRLFDLANNLDVSGEAIELVKVLEDRFPNLMTKPYRVDFTGALAALFCDLGIESDKIPQLLTVAALISLIFTTSSSVT